MSDLIPQLTQQFFNGLSLGAIYALIAIGYTMVYGIIGMINFAHGEIYMIGAYVGLVTLTAIGTNSGLPVPFIIAAMLLVAIVVTGIYGFSVERVAYRPVRGSPRLVALISAIGMSIFLSNFVQVAQGPRNKPVPTMLNDTIAIPIGSGSATISEKQLLIFVVTAVLLAAFWALVQKTKLGRAQRACEQDRRMAALLGIDVNRTVSLTFVIGGALAAVAGLMFMTYYGVVNFSDGFTPGVKAFTAAVLGGIGSLPGAVIGGLLIGLIETMWSAYFSIDYKDVAAFSILAVVLIFMPSGLLGRPDVEKV